MALMMTTVLICVPLMLCVKPVYLLACKTKHSEVADDFEQHGSTNYRLGDDDFMAANAAKESPLKSKDDPYNLRKDVIDSY